MPARLLMVFLLLSPAMLLAKQSNEVKQEMELFEFLAMFEEKDEVYIDAEINDEEIKIVGNKDKLT